MLFLFLVVQAPSLGGCPIFPDNYIFNAPIAQLPVHPNSQAFIDTMGTDDVELHLDLGTETNQQDAEFYGIPWQLVNADALTWKDIRFHTDDPDADFDGEEESDCGDSNKMLVTPCTVGSPKFPIPDNPIVEGGVRTDQLDYGDHHILMVDTAHCHLWEVFHAYKTGAGWDVLSTAFFDLRSNALRPDTWTSADAAGFPILPLLLKASEASSGTINHALRFTIPSGSIRNTYVWPATHKTNNGGNSMNKPPMGQLFRLKASFQIPSGFSTQSKAILQALKTYGMYLADGGSTAYITGEPSADWDESIFDEVQSVSHREFEAVDISAITARAGFDPRSGAVPDVPAGDPGTPGSPGASGPVASTGQPVTETPTPNSPTGARGCGCGADSDGAALFMLVLCLPLLLRRRPTCPTKL